MLYLDTCVLIPLFLQESTSDSIHAFFELNTQQSMLISAWTQTEFASAIAFKVRSCQLDAPAALDVVRTFHDIAAESFTILLPSANDYAQSQSYLTQFDTGLRAGDALHLAIANTHRATLATHDQLMLAAAAVLGIPTVTP